MIKEDLKISDTVIIPLGSLESHGPHNAVGSCYLLADAASKIVGERTGISVTPTIPFGVSDNYKNFPGTITRSSETLHRYTREACESLIRSGFRKIVFFSAHGAKNLSTLEELSYELREKYGVLCIIVHLWGIVQQVTPCDFWGADLLIAHGGEPVTSVMMYLYPEVVDLEKVDWKPAKQHFAKIKSSRGIAINIPLFIEEISERGCVGDPRRGSAKKGEFLINRLIENLVELIEDIQKIDPKLGCDK